jgi:hypothetical protein
MARDGGEARRVRPGKNRGAAEAAPHVLLAPFALARSLALDEPTTIQLI